MRSLLACCLALVAFAAHAGEAAYTVRPTELKARPFTDAETLARLPEKTPVEVLTRKSSWMQIRREGTTGWVKMLNLRLGDMNARQSGDSGLATLFNVAATGGSGNTTATGVRGLSEEKLRNPQPNPQALVELKRYSTNKQDARSFGSSGRLATHQIDYLPAK